MFEKELAESRLVPGVESGVFDILEGLLCGVVLVRAVLLCCVDGVGAVLLCGGPVRLDKVLELLLRRGACGHRDVVLFEPCSELGGVPILVCYDDV